MARVTPHFQEKCFQLKADFIPLTVIKLSLPNLSGIEEQLRQIHHQAPHYFQQTPVVLDVSLLPEITIPELNTILTLFRTYQLIPMGLRGLHQDKQTNAQSLGIALFNTPSANEKPTDISDNPPPSTKIIAKPVRSGTQVYAKQGDLIILAGVNAGGECMAAGNIHIYGPLRGRALAGINGDTNARIFCHTLEAELIAIAGRYQVNENLKVPQHHNGMLQIFLKNNQLMIDMI